MHGLSKSKLTAYRQCPKRLWLETFKPTESRPSAGMRLAMHNGNRIGEAARARYPNGLLIDSPNLSEALRATQAALTAVPARPLFEATFQSEGVLVRVDVLLPSGTGAELSEVKGSTSLKDYHHEDAAIQAWVVRAAGLKVGKVSIAHVDRGFVYRGDGDYTGLFTHHDVTPDVEALQPAIGRWVTGARATLEGPEPVIRCGAQCRLPYECSFRAYCAAAQGDAAAFPLDDLYRASAQLKDSLRAAGFRDIRKVPAKLLRSEINQRIQQAAISQQPYLDHKAGDALRAAPYPRRYLDFETILVGLPIWPGTRPGMQIPFQRSCHVVHEQGAIEHAAFLASDGGDPRPHFAQTLLDACGDKVPIYAYHAQFECQRLQELAQHFPHLAPRIDAVRARIVDLEVMTRDSYYHPDMHGSWSLKRVLPTIAPDLDYSSLAVSDGNLAQEAYLEMVDAATPPERRTELRAQLLAYCARDTEALIRIADFLEQAHAE